MPETTTFVMSDIFSSSTPALPAARNVKSLSMDDASKVIVAVHEGRLPALIRRFNKAEHGSIKIGDVYVFEVTAALDDDVGEGFERFTDGKAWNSGRCKGVSLLYYVMTSTISEDSPLTGVCYLLRKGREKQL